MTNRNFLLGKGERLIENIEGVRGGGPKHPPYTFEEARRRLTPNLSAVVKALDNLPDQACPKDQAIVAVTLNPEYIAKSYYPDDLFKTVGLEPVGSRPRRITPEKRSRGRTPEQAITTEIFVLGSRSAYHNWYKSLPQWSSDSREASDFIRIERIASISVDEKIKGSIPDSGKVVLEIVLHTDELSGENDILPIFQSYLGEIGIESPIRRRFYAGGLCFIELDAPAEAAKQIAIFSPVRALRQMPQLRLLKPTIRTSGIPARSLALPKEPVLDPDIRVAIFDGGLPDRHPLTAWATPFNTTGIAKPENEYLRHGVHVTSAFLFGHIDPTKPLPRPYADVDHYRVLDGAPGQNPHELFEVLGRIDDILRHHPYDLVNISLGPKLPIEDDDIHAWTAVLDDRLSPGTTLTTIAVGNDGESDASLGFNRIQVPADCVNALAIGACDSPDATWQRATYSSVGPGRSPGIIKPDLVAFGGSLQRPFLVVSHDPKPNYAPDIDATGGTSYAAPLVLRMAAGIRAHIGPDLGMLAIRTLLIHSAEPADHPVKEIGRGRLASTLDDVLICGDDTVRVVYQGTISPARYIRARIPLPPNTVPGKIRIAATLCYATAVDPHHPGNYTRAGLEITFRPHDKRRKNSNQIHADPKSFFGKVQSGLTEDELRRDSWKWENCLHGEVTFQSRTLSNPVFDIHYNSRLEGRNFTPNHELAYALVVSVQAKQQADLYNQVVRTYGSILQKLSPVIDIPVKI